MTDLTRFLERNIDRWSHRRTLFLNTPLFTLDSRITAQQPRFFLQDYARYQQWSHRAPNVLFGVFPETEDPGDRDIVLALPREKALLRAWLDWTCSVMGEGDRLWLAGANRAGIRSAGQALKAFFHRAEKQDSARHCQLFLAQGPLQQTVFDLERHVITRDNAHRDRPLTLASLPGVFSHGKLDEGTRLLLETLTPASVHGRVLDFGCGSGIIAAALGRDNGALELELVDNSALALESSRRTLELNGVAGRVSASNGLDSVDGQFDFIISNPPFHRGHHTQPDMSMELLRDVRNFLTANGQLIMVVNRHLPYCTWFESVFGQCEVLGENRRYHVLRAVRSRSR